MKSKVYFIGVKDADDIRSVNDKLKKLLEKSRVLDFISKEDRVAIKAHFGEEGNTGFVRPSHMAVICDEVIRRATAAFLSDANTLYRGKRLNSKDHRALAYAHGFTKEAVGLEVFIPDDGKPPGLIVHARGGPPARLQYLIDQIITDLFVCEGPDTPAGLNEIQHARLPWLKLCS